MEANRVAGLIARETEQPLTMRSSNLAIDIDGFVSTILARLTYFNQFDHKVHGKFVYKDSGSYITALRATVNNKQSISIRTDEFSEKYIDDASIAEGFQLSVGRIPPKGKVVLEVSVVGKLETAGEALCFKTTQVFTPLLRFNPVLQQKEIDWQYDVNCRPCVEYASEPYMFDMKIRACMPCLLAGCFSPSHAIQVDADAYATNAETVLISLAEKYKFDREIEVLFYPSQPLQPYVTIELGKYSRLKEPDFLSDAIIAVSFMPDLPKQSIYGEYVFMVDRSGSMNGAHICNAREALVLFLKSLPSTVFFNVVSFGSYSRTLFPTSRAYNQENLEKACSYANSMRADMGGSELLQPLQMVMGQPLATGRTRNIFLLTDGDISNSEIILDYLRGSSPRTRVFTFGIGPKIFYNIVSSIANVGRGKAYFANPKNNIQTKRLKRGREVRWNGMAGNEFARTVTSQIVQCLKETLQPVLCNIKVDWELPESFSIRYSSQDIPFAPQGQRLNLFASVTLPTKRSLKDSQFDQSGIKEFWFDEDFDSCQLGDNVFLDETVDDDDFLGDWCSNTDIHSQCSDYQPLADGSDEYSSEGELERTPTKRKRHGGESMDCTSEEMEYVRFGNDVCDIYDNNNQRNEIPVDYNYGNDNGDSDRLIDGYDNDATTNTISDDSSDLKSNTANNKIVEPVKGYSDRINYGYDASATGMTTKSNQIYLKGADEAEDETSYHNTIAWETTTLTDNKGCVKYYEADEGHTNSQDTACFQKDDESMVDCGYDRQSGSKYYEATANGTNGTNGTCEDQKEIHSDIINPDHYISTSTITTNTDNYDHILTTTNTSKPVNTMLTSDETSADNDSSTTNTTASAIIKDNHIHPVDTTIATIKDHTQPDNTTINTIGNNNVIDTATFVPENTTDSTKTTIATEDHNSKANSSTITGVENHNHPSTILSDTDNTNPPNNATITTDYHDSPIDITSTDDHSHFSNIGTITTKHCIASEIDPTNSRSNITIHNIDANTTTNQNTTSTNPLTATTTSTNPLMTTTINTNHKNVHEITNMTTHTDNSSSDNGNTNTIEIINGKVYYHRKPPTLKKNTMAYKHSNSTHLQTDTLKRERRLGNSGLSSYEAVRHNPKYITPLWNTSFSRNSQPSLVDLYDVPRLDDPFNTDEHTEDHMGKSPQPRNTNNSNIPAFQSFAPRTENYRSKSSPKRSYTRNTECDHVTSTFSTCEWGSLNLTGFLGPDVFRKRVPFCLKATSSNTDRVGLHRMAALVFIRSLETSLGNGDNDDVIIREIVELSKLSDMPSRFTTKVAVNEEGEIVCSAQDFENSYVLREHQPFPPVSSRKNSVQIRSEDQPPAILVSCPSVDEFTSLPTRSHRAMSELDHSSDEESKYYRLERLAPEGCDQVKSTTDEHHHRRKIGEHRHIPMKTIQRRRLVSARLTLLTKKMKNAQKLNVFSGPPFIRFILLQAADGFWELTFAFARIIGLPLVQLELAAPFADCTMIPLGDQDDQLGIDGYYDSLALWATAIGIVYLEKKWRTYEREWELVALKATSWIKSQTLPQGFSYNDVILSAKQALVLLEQKYRTRAKSEPVGLINTRD